MTAILADSITAHPASPSTASRSARRIEFFICAMLLLGPALVFFPSLLGQRILLPIDNLLLMQPWAAQAQAILPGFQTPHNALISDMIIQNLGWKRFLVQELLRGHLPLWNPDMLGGAPFLAAGQYQVLYPFVLWFVIMPIAYAYSFYTVSQLGLAAVFAYLYLRSVGEGRLGAVLTGVVFSLCSSLLTSVLWPQMIGAMVWLPAILACVELTMRGLGVREPAREQHRPVLVISGVVLGALAIGLEVLAGHLEITFYVLSTTSVYCLWHLLRIVLQRLSWRQVTSTAAWLLTMGILGVGLSAVQLLPFAEEISRNFRANSVTLADVRGWALPLRQLVTFIIPDFFGNPTVHHYVDLFSFHIRQPGLGVDGRSSWPPDTAFWGIKNYVEAASYVGIIPLALAPLGVMIRRNRISYFFAVLVVISLLLAFGSPLYAILFRLVPGFTQIHTAFRWVYVYSFSIAVLSGIGLNSIFQHRSNHIVRHLANFHVILVGLCAVGTILGVVISFIYRSRIATFLTEILQRDASKPKNQWFLANQLHGGREWFSLVWPHIVVAVFFLTCCAILLCILVFLANHRYLRFSAAIALIGLTYADLVAATGGFNSQVNPSLLSIVGGAYATIQNNQEIPPSIRYLISQEKANSPFRIASFGPQDILAPNTAMIFGLQDIRGYDTIVLRRYARLLNLIEPQMANLNLYSQTTKTLVDKATLQSPLLRLLNVKYVLSVDALQAPNLDQVLSGPINVYRMTSTLPRAFVVGRAVTVHRQSQALALLSQPAFDPAHEAVLEDDAPIHLDGTGTAEIQSYQSSRITLDVQTTGTSALVLSDTYYPGWTVRYRPVHEAGPWTQAKIVPADEAFRGVVLPAGHFIVEFRYQPASFRLGLMLSIISFVALLLLFVWKMWPSLEEFWHLSDFPGRRLAKNAMSPMASNLANKVLDFGFSVFTALLIGPTGVGRYAEAVAIFGILSTIQDFGLSTYVLRAVARDHSQARRYFWNSLGARFMLALIALPVTWLLTALAVRSGRYDVMTATALWLLVIGLFPSSVSAAASSMLKALEHFEIPAFIEVSSNLLRVLIGAFFLIKGWNIVGLALASFMVNIFSAILLSIMLYRAKLSLIFAIDIPDTVNMSIGSFTFMVNNLLNLIFFRIDVVLLTFLWGNAAGIGYYSIAYKFIDGCGFISSYLVGASFPLLSRYATSSLSDFTYLYGRLMRILTASALFLISIFIVFSYPIIRVFYPGFEYSAFLLQILIFFLIFSYINGLTQYVLISLGKERYITSSFIIGVSFNIIANIIFIPLLHSEAAAIITVLSEVVLLIPFLYGVRHICVYLPWRRISIPSLVSSIGSITTGVLTSSHSLVFALPASVIVYILLFISSGGLTDDERGKLTHLLNRSYRTIEALL
ncbi:MAG: oligosaccharide flippase family protein [Chloroflexi bacterium]|nr:oligosaccharide flippase family protein [Chloroflexota bacterium]